MRPWFRKFSWRRKWQSIPVFSPGKSHGRRSLLGYSPWDSKQSDTTGWLHFHFHFQKAQNLVTPNLVSFNMVLGHGWQVFQNIFKFVYYCSCNTNFHICLHGNREYNLIISGWRINKGNLKAVTVRASEMLLYQSWELQFDLFSQYQKHLALASK